MKRKILSSIILMMTCVCLVLASADPVSAQGNGLIFEEVHLIDKWDPDSGEESYFTLSISGVNNSSTKLIDPCAKMSPGDICASPTNDYESVGTAQRGNTLRFHLNWSGFSAKYPEGYKELTLTLETKDGTYCGIGSPRAYLLDQNEEAKRKRDAEYGDTYDSAYPWLTNISQTDSELIMDILAPTESEIEKIYLNLQFRGLGIEYFYGEGSCKEAVTIDLTGPSSPAVCPVATQTIKATAQVNPGEDAGTDVFSEIIEGLKKLIDNFSREALAGTALVSIGGALATAGALSASSGSKNKGDKDKKEEEKKKKTYKMKIYKDFGDGIKKGVDPVRVWARIVEIEEFEGRIQETIRDDLTANISASGEGMNVRPIGMENSWKGAEVSIPTDSEASTATLIFTFTGKGGAMNNRITFRVVGEPEIIYPAVSQDGKHWDVNDQDNQVDMIAGVSVVERLRFVIKDTAEEPKTIRFKADHEGFNITYEKDPQWQFTYYACIENRTEPIEKESGIFASMITVSVRIEAEFRDGVTIWSLFPIRLFPEGLSAQGNLTDGRLTVNTLPPEKPTENGIVKIPPTVFSLTLAYPDGNGHTVVFEEPCWTPQELKDDGKYGLMFKENFKYKIKYQSASEIAFYPENTLPCLGDPYEVYMHIDVDTRWTEGRDYSSDLPMAFLGEEPKRIYSDNERETEMKHLKWDLKYFGLSGDPNLSYLLHMAARGECSANEIRNIRYRLLEAAKAFYEEEGDAQKRMSELFSRYYVVAGAVLKSCDYGLAFVANKQWPGYGEITVKFLTPFKNLLFSFVGECYPFFGSAFSEYISDSGSTEEPDYVEAALKSAEDAMASAISFLIAPDTSITDQVLKDRQTNALAEIQNAMGYIVATYLLVCYVEHYYGYNGKGKKGEKGDIFRSITAAFVDLTYEGLKAFMLKFIEERCKHLFTKFGEWCGKQYMKVIQKRIDEAVVKAGKKAFEENIRGKFKDVSIPGLDIKNYSELSKDVFDHAMEAKDVAIKETTKALNEEAAGTIAAFTKWLVKEADNDQKSIIIGQTINYFLGRDGKDGTDYGSDAKEVVYNWLTKWLGLKIFGNDVYDIGGVLNPFSVTLQVKDGKIFYGFFGVVAEISILENIMTLSDLLFERLFSWMDALWEYSKIRFDSENIPDERERIEKSTAKIKQEILTTGRRIESYRWEYTKYRIKSKDGWKDII